MDRARTGDSTEKSTRDHSADLRTVVDAAECPLSVHVPSGKCIEANDAVGRMTGRPRSVLLGRSISDFLVDGDPSTDVRLFSRLRGEGTARERFHTYIPGRGLRWLEVTATRALVIGRRLIQIHWADITAALEGGAPDDDESVASAVNALLRAMTPENVLLKLMEALDGRAACRAALGEEHEIVEGQNVVLGPITTPKNVFDVLSDAASGTAVGPLETLAPECPVVMSGGFESARAVRDHHGLVTVFDARRDLSEVAARAILGTAAARLEVLAEQERGGHPEADRRSEGSDQ